MNADKRKQQWPNNLASDSTMKFHDLAEMESHLDDSIEELEAMGISRDEATMLAIHRLGDAQDLSDEFEKVNGSNKKIKYLFLMAAGALFYPLANTFARLLANGSAHLVEINNREGYAAYYLTADLAHIAFFLIIISFACYLLLRTGRNLGMLGAKLSGWASCRWKLAGILLAYSLTTSALASVATCLNIYASNKASGHEFSDPDRLMYSLTFGSSFTHLLLLLLALIFVPKLARKINSNNQGYETTN